MPERHNARPIAVVTACMTAEGTPELQLTTVEATPAEIENGIHYYLVEGELLERGYEEPFVHFDETESPSFLHPVVRRHLDAAIHPTIHSSEKQVCPA